ncbi:MAG TPA: hypothetical protein VNP92_14390 [Actinophytocola sp.]|nr:hypothetical protein [Actinophytocola sp.]
MRNRVALTAARTRAAMMSKLVRMSVIMALVPVVLVTAAQAAAADTLAAEEIAADGVAGLAGPVGIGAVVLGFGGLIIGLLRHRRRDAGALPVPGALPVLDAQRPTPEPAGGERAV